MENNRQTDDPILSQLSETQQAAVAYCDGPQLVIAGAGSGKTRVLTFKIAWLLTHYDLKPWEILALTFTNKAAREMNSRIATIVGPERARYLQMGTFHSVFSRILRVESAATGFTSNFTIYDEADSRSLIKNIVKTLGLDDKAYKPSSVGSAISLAKNQLCLPEQYAADGDRLAADRMRQMPQLFQIYSVYQQRLRQANAMDFDDLLIETWRLFRDHEDIRRKYVERFKYVLVDEYQDTNFVQQQILWQLTKERQRVSVVGDDYQSIYAFRGANINNILNFSKLYTDVRLFKLEQNYRSTQNIVAAANSLMKHNRRQIEKDVYSRNAVGDKVVICETSSDRREAAMVCREIKRLMRQEGTSYHDFAILYRTHGQSRVIEEEMMKPEVGMAGHYAIYAGTSFYQRAEIKNIIAYLRLVVNPHDDEAFRRIINYPARSIGNTTLQKIVDAAQVGAMSLWEVIEKPETNLPNVNRSTQAKLSAFRQFIEGEQAKAQSEDALNIAQEILKESGMEADLAADKSPEGDGRRENIESLVSGIADFVDAQREQGRDGIFLPDYLATVSLMTDADNSSDSDDKVTLMTIHSAKGLEFNTVFIVGLEENIFPSMMAAESAHELEEERRLLYVAITRAEKHCYLSWAHMRWRFGKMDPFVQPSRFIAEIDPRYTETRSDGGSGDTGGRRRWGSGSTSSLNWDSDYQSNRRYTGYNDGTARREDNRMQNSHPVADRFMADPKPKITHPHQPEQAVNPFSSSLEQKLKEGGHWVKISKAMANGGRSGGAASSAGSSDRSSQRGAAPAASGRLKVGMVVQHQRFGRGVVERLEGEGPDRKAFVNFDDCGRKQLLLKFARLTIVSE